MRHSLKRPRLDPLSEAGLRRKVQHHLGRYWPSVAQMRRVLMRHIDRNIRRWGGDRELAESLVEPLLTELVESGGLDDFAFSRAWVEQLDRKGSSRRAIFAKMREKGIGRDLVQNELERIEGHGSERELWRAIVYARRRRLGPARFDPLHRAERRKKDMAAMARAGFSYGIVVQVIDCEDLMALAETVETVDDD